VQDTTEANWTDVGVTEGLGPLGNSACHGLLVHTTFAMTPERVPLGLLAQAAGFEFVWPHEAIVPPWFL
jgi:hypothetical protein